MPPDEPPTSPELPIIRGEAERSIRDAFASLAKAVRDAEAVAVAVGRALDEGAQL
jgi:hypothetical protein